MEDDKRVTLRLESKQFPAGITHRDSPRVNISINGVPLASYNMADREDAPRAEVRAVDRLLAEEVRRRLDLPPDRSLAAQTVDTGTGEVIDVCAAPTFQIGSQDYDQCPFCLKPVMFVAYQSHLAKCREAYGDPNIPCDCECDPLACPRHGKRNWDAMSKDSSKP